jgi:hypothetical protein
MSMLKELRAVLRTHKRFWLLPVLIMMGLLGLLIVMDQGSDNAPCIYTLF